MATNEGEEPKKARPPRGQPANAAATLGGQQEFLKAE